MISLDISVVYQIVFFLVLWFVLSKVLFRPYLKLLEEREGKTAGAIHDTADLEREGARLKAQYEERIAQPPAAAEHHAPSITQILFPLGNFLIYAYIIKRFALPVVRDFLRSRREGILTSIESAAESKTQAEAVVSSYQAKLAGIHREGGAVQAELRAEGGREK